METKRIALDLELFDEGGGAAGAAGAESSAALGEAAAQKAAPAVAAGADDGDAAIAGNEKPKADEEMKAQRRAEFEARIKGEDKELFDERVQAILNERFKGTKKQEESMRTMQTRLEKQQAIVDLIGTRYRDVDLTNPDALMKAIENDDTMWEQYAADHEMSVAEAKRVAKIERENAAFKRSEAQNMVMRMKEETYTRISAEADECKRAYKAFDIAAESKNPQFEKLIKAGIPVKTAYETVHMDELMTGVIRYTANNVAKKVTDDVRARGLRPDENGLKAGGAAAVKMDVNKMTDEQLADLHRRALAGELVNPFSG